MKKYPKNIAYGKPMNIGATIEKNSLRFTIVNMKQIIAEYSIIAYQEYVNLL